MLIELGRPWVLTHHLPGGSLVQCMSKHRMYNTPREYHTSLTKPHPAGMATYVTTMTFWLKNPSRVQSGLDFEKYLSF